MSTSDEFDYAPISWSRAPSAGNVFPYGVRSSRPLSAREVGYLRRRCLDQIGSGGTFPGLDHVWTVSHDGDTFSFKRDVDAALFVMFT